MGFHFPPIMTWEEPACWVTATRKHAENRPAMLQSATTALPAFSCTKDNLSTVSLSLLNFQALFDPLLRDNHKRKMGVKWSTNKAIHVNNSHYPGWIAQHWMHLFSVIVLSLSLLMDFYEWILASVPVAIPWESNCACFWTESVHAALSVRHLLCSLMATAPSTLANATQFPQTTPCWLAITGSVLSWLEENKRM